MFKVNNPKKIFQDFSDKQKEDLISLKLEERLEEEKKKLKPEIITEIREQKIFVPKIEYVFKKNPLNKALFAAVIILGLAFVLFAFKGSFAASRLLNIKNYYEPQSDQMLGDTVYNPVSTLSRLRDVSLGSPTNGQVLTYNGASLWEASSTASGLSSTLNSGLIFIGNHVNVAEASSTSNLTGLPYTTSSLNSGLVFIGNHVNTAEASSTSNLTGLPYLGSTLNSGLVFIGNGQNTAEASSTSNLTGLPYLSTSLASQNLIIGNHVGTAEATTSIGSSLVAISSLNGANDDLTNLVDGVFSSGKISGGKFTDNGDGTIKVGAGLGMARTTDNATTTLRFIYWAENASVSLTDDSLNYIIVSYNLGSPSVSATTNLEAINNTTQFPIGVAFRKGTDAEIVEDGTWLPNYRARAWTRLAHRGIERMSGGSISASSTMGFGLTATVVYYSDQEVNNTAKHVDGNNTMTVYYRDGGTGWTASTSHRIRSTVYDDNSGTPAPLTANRYSTYFIFECLEGNIYAVMGQGDYTLTQAQQAQLPSTLPNYLTYFAYPYGKIITQKSASVFTEIQNNVKQNFVLASATAHNDLSGIQGGAANDYYHLTSASTTQLTTFKNKIGLGDLSSTATGLTYTNTSGVFSLTSGYNIPLTASTSKWNAWFHASTTKIGLTDLSCTATGLTYTNTTGVTSLTAGYNIPTTASTSKWNAWFHASSTKDFTITIASSSWSSTAGASTTIRIGQAATAEQWFQAMCYVNSGTSLKVQFGDCTAYTAVVPLTTATTTQTAISFTFAQTKQRCAKVGSQVGNPDWMTCTIIKRVQGLY